MGLALTTIASAQIITSNVNFARGRMATIIPGMIAGDQTRDYVVRANAGQTLRVRLAGSPIVYFNVLPPGSNDQAIFIGSNEGRNFSGTLSASGAYKIRVYQMRASARRGERGAFRLDISVAGGRPMMAGNGLAGLAGMNSIRAIDVMTERGFANVDSSTMANTQYGIYYNRATRVCAQLTMADGRVVAANDIRVHPKCR
ncbi:hypothetical protein ABDK56_09175 [Sphingomonas sp. ASV193]|uniref:hypothetical protein n=1 Tax=Sphingomonas sp. ASV193 TaxID=3144405 RepID=UPI0032E8A1A8